uniref:KIB1-4 beta-propeller domain-containing protein n=1 Tax=Leersia perrieri TaxID=77586 RepID=A0A0D9X131_9ORYZ
MTPAACRERAAVSSSSSSSKRPRLAAAAADVARRPWASLPGDLVQLIGWCLLAGGGGDLRDYIRFRAACSGWHSTTASPRSRGILDPRFHPRRWMMLPEGRDGDFLPGGKSNLNGGDLRFLHLSTGSLVAVHLPLLAGDGDEGHSLLDSTDGILILLRRHDTAIRLLHPFTGDIADLPPLSSILPQVDSQFRYFHPLIAEYFERYISGDHPWISTAITITAAGNITVMLNLRIPSLGNELISIAHATTGDDDKQWTLSCWKMNHLVAWTTPFQGKFYAVMAAKGNFTDKVSIYQIDPPPAPQSNLTLPPLAPRMIAECPLLVGSAIGAASLVEYGSELMLVGFTDASLAHLVVYRLNDLISGRVVAVTSIGDHAFFLGERGWFWITDVSVFSSGACRTEVGFAIVQLNKKVTISDFRSTFGIDGYFGKSTLCSYKYMIDSFYCHEDFFEMFAAPLQLGLRTHKGLKFRQ